LTAPLTEHELARLLSGSIQEKERRSLLARLAADPDGRMMLSMAMEALESAETGPAPRRSAGRRAA
jgi:hypothetical protein